MNFNINQLDTHTLENIARSLWISEFNEKEIDSLLLEKIFSKKNSNQAFAQRFIQHINYLKKNYLSYTPSYTKRYDLMLKHTTALSPQQYYMRSLFLGPELVVGYDKLSTNPQFSFPQDDLPHLGHQVEWHFFVGNAYDENKNHYSIQIMFWRVTLMPPPLAQELGLTEIENQIIELHLAISDKTNNIHYRAEPTIIAGTTGLISFKSKPFNYSMGKNILQGVSNDGSLFPLQIKAFGVDSERNGTIEVNIYLTDNKGYFLESEDGCRPSIDGIGTLYYSAANLSLDNSISQNTIKIGNKSINLIHGKFWYDHQWGTGFLPPGALNTQAMRAANSLINPKLRGWDWFMVQFHPDCNNQESELAISAFHKSHNDRFYNNKSKENPGIMHAQFFGQFINPDNNTIEFTGQVIVEHWVQSITSPNSKYYPPTYVWHPASFKFKIDTQAIPQKYREFSLKPIISNGQTGFFANGLQYSEGGAIAFDINGKEIGIGFAESAGYARNIENILNYTLLPINEFTLKFKERPKTSLPEKIKYLLYAIKHIKDILRVLKTAKGINLEKRKL